MKKIALAAALALAFIRPATATPITGNVAIAGASSYTSTGISFGLPAIVLIGTGDFASLVGDLIPVSNITFASAVGTDLFTTSNGISMDITSLNVVLNSSNFLNAIGTANMMGAGFDTTAYAFTLTGQRPDGISSFTMAAVPTIVPEPGPLLLISTGLITLAGLLYWKKRETNCA